MKYLLVAFKSRNSLLAFTKNLRLNGIAVEVVNTPRAISISCGLSAKLNLTYTNFVINLLSHNVYENFVGVYLVARVGLKEQISKIY